MYDPGLQRFLQPDPLGLGGGQLNDYEFVGDNPVNETDPSGLQAQGNLPAWAGNKTPEQFNKEWKPYMKDVWLQTVVNKQGYIVAYKFKDRTGNEFVVSGSSPRNISGSPVTAANGKTAITRVTPKSTRPGLGPKEEDLEPAGRCVYPSAVNYFVITTSNGSISRIYWLNAGYGVKRDRNAPLNDKGAKERDKAARQALDAQAAKIIQANFNNPAEAEKQLAALAQASDLVEQKSKLVTKPGKGLDVEYSPTQKQINTQVITVQYK